MARTIGPDAFTFRLCLCMFEYAYERESVGYNLTYIWRVQFMFVLAFLISLADFHCKLFFFEFYFYFFVCVQFSFIVYFLGFSWCSSPCTYFFIPIPNIGRKIFFSLAIWMCGPHTTTHISIICEGGPIERGRLSGDHTTHGLYKHVSSVCLYGWTDIHTCIHIQKKPIVQYEQISFVFSFSSLRMKLYIYNKI